MVLRRAVGLMSDRSTPGECLAYRTPRDDRYTDHGHILTPHRLLPLPLQREPPRSLQGLLMDNLRDAK